MQREVKNTEIKYDRIIQWLLLLLVFALPLIVLPGLDDNFGLPKVTLFRLVVLGVLITWTFKILFSNRVAWRKTSFDIPILIFAGAILLSTIVSISPLASLLGLRFRRQEGLLAWFSYFITYFVASNYITDRKTAVRLIRTMVIASAIVSLYGIAQHFGYHFIGLELTSNVRIFATFGNAAFLAGYLVLTSPLSLILSLEEPRIAVRLLWLSVFIFNIIALVLTYTRGAWLGAILGLGLAIFYGLRTAPTGQLRRKPAILFVILAFLIIAAAVYVTERRTPEGMSVADRISSAIKLRGSDASRLSIWNSTLFLIAEKPALGWGLETFGYAFSPYRERIFGQLVGIGKIVDRPHNQPLYIAFSTGALGLLTYLWIVGLLVCLLTRWLGKTSQQANQQTNQPANKPTSQQAMLVVGLYAACLGYLVQEQFLFSQIGATPLFWILLGMTASASTGKRQVLRHSFSLPSIGKHLLIVIFSVAFILCVWWSTKFVIADYYYLQGQLATRERFHTQASEYYERAVKYSPWQTKYRFALGESYNALAVSQRNPYWLKLADRTSRQSIALSPRDYELYFSLGSTYYVLSTLRNDGDYSLAKSYYSKTIELEPFFADSYVWLGKIYLLEGKHKEALEVLQKSLVLDPKHIKALDFLGQTYEALNRPEMAQLYYQRILKIDPNYKRAQQRLRILNHK